jgi:hypothetical protein
MPIPINGRKKRRRSWSKVAIQLDGRQLGHSFPVHMHQNVQFVRNLNNGMSKNTEVAKKFDDMSHFRSETIAGWQMLCNICLPAAAKRATNIRHFCGCVPLTMVTYAIIVGLPTEWHWRLVSAGCFVPATFLLLLGCCWQ